MSLFYTPLNEISSDDIQGLIENRVRESRTIDYKEAFPTGPDDIEKFCAAVCSFANTAGGDILYGIRDRRENGKPTGEPEQIIPLESNFDTERLRLLQAIKSSIEPRMSACRIESVTVPGGYVCIVRVPKSWMGLYALRKNEGYRFYHRTSAGKSTMDMSEIRAAFVASDNGYDRLRHFRAERLRKISERETPVDIQSGPIAVLHIIPFSALDPTIQFDLEPLVRNHTFRPMYSNSVSHRYTFDGIVKFETDHPTHSYVQVFRSGVFEACLINCNNPEKTKLYLTAIEHHLVKSLRSYFDVASSMGISRPFMIGLSLLGVKNVSIDIPFASPCRVIPFRENVLMVPELLQDNDETPVHTFLRPALDRIWNAGGVSKSPNFDTNGFFLKHDSMA